MSTATEATVVKITRTVTVDLEPDEYIPVDGDRKGSGHRVARAVRIRIVYEFLASEWLAGWYSLKLLTEQQKADGSWSEAKWVSSYRMAHAEGEALIARYMPTSSYTVTEVTT